VAPSRRRRWPFVAAALVGVGLIAAPAVFGMFTKAPKGAQMISSFKPYMTAPRLNGYQRDLQQIDAGVSEVDTNVAPALEASPAGPAAFAHFRRSYPDFASFDRQWPTIDRTMERLMNSVQGNLGNYEAVAALPSFNLFPYFFVVPGLLILAFALLGLRRNSTARWPVIALVVMGIWLIAAPAIFQMFSRAPKGGSMMTAFKTIETTRNVQNIQTYFGTMATGQGAVRLEIVPALEKAGYSAPQIATTFPAVSTLDANWVHILNDMTPMIGAMGDNVTNYQAVASLPPFPLFPWFFVVPGVLVASLALAADRSRRTKASGTVSYEPISVPSLPIREGVPS
jgi:4-amino-4-deoxy-L-arabinose transferase-like glycosyltransferase